MQATMCLYIRIILSTLYSISNQPNNYIYGYLKIFEHLISS